MTFNVYRQFLITSMNEIKEIKHRQDMRELEEKIVSKHRKEIDELKKEFQIQIQQIQARRWFEW